MRSLRSAIAIVVSVSFWACAANPRPETTASPSADIAQAEELVQRGCYACLHDALAIYERLLSAGGTSHEITDGAFRAALLLGARETEMGILGSGMARAADLFSGLLPPPDHGTLYLDVARMVRLQSIGMPKDLVDEHTDVLMAGRQQREQWSAALRPLMSQDPVAAYLYIALSCAGRRSELPVDALSLADSHPDSLFIRFRLALCVRSDTETFGALLAQEPRFTEVRFFQALRTQDSALAHQFYQQAHADQPTWPAPALQLAEQHRTFEEVPLSLDLYRKVLALVPGQADALLGEAEALSYLRQHPDALEILNTLASGRWNLGDVYYWRAWNLFNVQQVQPAADDITLAKTYRQDSEVFKLAGLIALDQERLLDARREFEEAVRRNANDCDAAFYLGRVHVLQSRWPETGSTFSGAASCYEAAVERLSGEIERLATDDSMTEERRARMRARREDERRAADRQRAACFYNAALGYFNDKVMGEARTYAEYASAHPDFSDRAAALLLRIDDLRD